MSIDHIIWISLKARKLLVNGLIFQGKNVKNSKQIHVHVFPFMNLFLFSLEKGSMFIIQLTSV